MSLRIPRVTRGIRRLIPRLAVASACQFSNYALRCESGNLVTRIESRPILQMPFGWQLRRFEVELGNHRRFRARHSTGAPVPPVGPCPSRAAIVELSPRLFRHTDQPPP